MFGISLNFKLLQRNPIFRNFLVATTVSLVGSSIFDLAMPLYVLQKTHSALALSLVSVALHLPYFIMAPVTGYSADLPNKRRVMLISDAGQVFFLTLLLIYDYSGFSAIWPILFMIFIAKTLMLAFETVSSFQLVPAIVSPAELSEANSWFLAANRSVQIVGPLLGGLLLALFGVRFCVLVNVLSFGATLIFTMRLKNLNDLIQKHVQVPHDMSILDAKAMMKSFFQSLKDIMRSETFRPFVFFMFCWNFSTFVPNTPTITYYFTVIHNLDPSTYGLVCCFVGLLSIFAFIPSNRLYQKNPIGEVLMLASYWQAVFGSLSIIFYPYPWAMAFIYGISRSFGSILVMGSFLIRQTEIPRERAGTMNATLRMIFMAAVPLSALFQAFLIEKLGAITALIFGALCLWAMTPFVRRTGAVLDADEEEVIKIQRTAAR